MPAVVVVLQACAPGVPAIITPELKRTQLTQPGQSVSCPVSGLILGAWSAALLQDQVLCPTVRT